MASVTVIEWTRQDPDSQTYEYIITIVTPNDNSWNEVIVSTRDGNRININLCNNYYYSPKQRQTAKIIDITRNRITANTLSRISCMHSLEATFLDLEVLENDQFSDLKRLEVLNMSHNAISFIPSMAFNDAENLRIIDFSFNRITTLYDMVFSRSVESFYSEIHLQNNLLSEIITNEAIGGVSLGLNISILNLHNNNNYSATNMVPSWKIDRINYANTSTTHLNITPNLFSINAEHCQIATIETTADNGLIELNVSHNALVSVANFSELVHLTVLDVSHNLIEFIDADVFLNMVELRYLDVSFNKLSQFPQPPTRDLQYLNIAFNQLASFQLDQTMSKLNTLRIDGNAMTTIDTNLRLVAPSLQWIGLNDNNYTCQHLTASLLMLFFDGVKPIIETNYLAEQDAQENVGYVKGVRCFHPKNNYDDLIAGASVTPNAAVGNNRVKEPADIENALFRSMQSKMEELENKTMDALNIQMERFKSHLIELYIDRNAN